MEKYIQIKEILGIAAKAPALLKNFLGEIPTELITKEKFKGKWTIHEHVCHLPLAQAMLNERLQRFIKEDKPIFKPYIPDTEETPKKLSDYNLKESLQQFEELRAAFIQLAQGRTESFWSKEAEHPEYTLYNPFIMTRHMMLHDQLHMYRIEELWLTKV